MPALVVHGLADKMVHVSGGRATAAAIPGAELLLIDGMGHDLPAGPLRDLRRRHPAYGGPRLGLNARQTLDRPARSGGSSGSRVLEQVESVGEALAGLGVEDVHAGRVGGDVDRVALVHLVAAG